VHVNVHPGWISLKEKKSYRVAALRDQAVKGLDHRITEGTAIHRAAVHQSDELLAGGPGDAGVAN
jgi:hypothetical protein